MQFHRWRRFGHDRLYLTADDGVKLGYLDLADRETPHLDASARTVEFHAGVDRWRQLGRPDDHTDAALTGVPDTKPQRVALRRPFHAPPSGPLPELVEDSGGWIKPAAQTTSASGWSDLALRRAGAGVADVAAVHRKAHPVRTRIDRIRGKHTDAQAWAKGAAGERKTGKVLDRLTSGEFGQQWEVLHSVTINARGSDIDHLLIGPPGIFTINTKHHPGKTVQVGPRTLTIDGYGHRDYLRIAASEAAIAHERLVTAGAAIPTTMAVWGILAFVGAIVIGDRQVDQVLCVDVDRLAVVMADYGNSHPYLDTSTITQIHSIARRSTTWNPDPSATG